VAEKEECGADLIRKVLMGELLTNQISKLRNLYKKSIAAIIAGTFLIIGARFIAPESMELSEKYAIMSKSAVILLFLMAVPFVVSNLRQHIRNIPSTLPLSERLSSYMYFFRIKSVIFLLLSALALVVFFFSHDPMILIFVLAVIVFFYFERPTRLKIQEDLKINE
jgi:predicted neutral ceramidase superfamily lipid hydrolase